MGRDVSAAPKNGLMKRTYPETWLDIELFVAPRGAGNPTHDHMNWHNTGFSWLAEGRKRWWFAPPSAKPLLDAIGTAKEGAGIYRTHLATMADKLDILVADQTTSELLYFPADWIHGTFNDDDAVNVLFSLYPVD